MGFWSYALAACAFASVVLWRARSRGDRSETLLLAACAGTAIWAAVAAVYGRTDAMTMTAGTLRNLLWVILLYDMSGGARRAPNGLRLVFGAVALSIGLHLALSFFTLIVPLTAAQFNDILTTGSLLRITTSAGALVLVHNVYGQAAPESRLRIRGPMLGLTLMWGYELNLSTLAYLQGVFAPSVDELFRLRGIVMAVIAPLFATSGGLKRSLRIKLSRAATFQSLSLLGICIYLSVMAILATAFRRSEAEWATVGTALLLGAMSTAAALLTMSQRVRGWLKVKLAKHLFEHRYDYRTEWLRFTDTLGRSGEEAPPLGDRIVKGFADIADAPGGLLLVADSAGALTAAAAWNWTGSHPPSGQSEPDSSFWGQIEARGRIVEFDALRHGYGPPDERLLPVPQWLLDDPAAWAGIPLIHHERLVGLVVLAAPDYRRPLDWEDFDLLRTAGRQAASSLAEAHGQEALSNAQRFEEFNRRFAFILHDVKNLVSQLSLVSRNAERHADNPEFRADMVATLKSSVGKMNDLLTRLSPRSSARVQRVEAQALRPALTAAIAAKRGDHDVKLIGDAGLWAEFDAPALEQAVGHLVQNAVEACSSALPVTVRVSSNAGAVAIAIADKGVGMDSDFLRNQLFQPFSSTKPGGFGIGAFEARSLVAAMGGRLGVESRPGRGTTFTIHLPAAEPVTEPIRKRA